MHASARKTKEETRQQGAKGDARRGSRTPKKRVGKTRAGEKGQGVKTSARGDLGRQASQELLKLRPILKDVGSALLDRLDGELAGLSHALNGRGMPGETPVLPKASVLSAILADIKALKLKPKKGRVKDLKRIEALLESLSARIPAGA